MSPHRHGRSPKMDPPEAEPDVFVCEPCDTFRLGGDLLEGETYEYDDGAVVVGWDCPECDTEVTTLLVREPEGI